MNAEEAASWTIVASLVQGGGPRETLVVALIVAQAVDENRSPADVAAELAASPAWAEEFDEQGMAAAGRRIRNVRRLNDGLVVAVRPRRLQG